MKKEYEVTREDMFRKPSEGRGIIPYLVGAYHYKFDTEEWLSLAKSEGPFKSDYNYENNEIISVKMDLDLKETSFGEPTRQFGLRNYLSQKYWKNLQSEINDFYEIKDSINALPLKEIFPELKNKYGPEELENLTGSTHDFLDFVLERDLRPEEAFNIFLVHSEENKNKIIKMIGTKAKCEQNITDSYVKETNFQISKGLVSRLEVKDSIRTEVGKFKMRYKHYPESFGEDLIQTF